LKWIYDDEFRRTSRWTVGKYFTRLCHCVPFVVSRRRCSAQCCAIWHYISPIHLKLTHSAKTPWDCSVIINNNGVMSVTFSCDGRDNGLITRECSENVVSAYKQLSGVIVVVRSLRVTQLNRNFLHVMEAEGLSSLGPYPESIRMISMFPGFIWIRSILHTWYIT
jgi:hypothetical protein